MNSEKEGRKEGREGVRLGMSLVPVKTIIIYVNPPQRTATASLAVRDGP